jgi:hypothetical protein
LGDRSLCSSTLPRQGSAPRAIFIDFIASVAVSIDFIASIAVSIDLTAISIDVAVSHDEERVVLPPGLRALPVAMWFTSLSHNVIFM